MRAIAAFVAVLSLSVPAAIAGGAPAPPVIREPFTALPCPRHPLSNFDQKACAGQALLRSDRAINGLARTIFYRLQTRAARVAFVSGERAWLRYRRASCSAEASVFRGGTAEGLVLLQCQIRRNKRHLVDLAQMKQALREP